MSTYCPNNEIKNYLIDVSEEINPNNIKEFIFTSLSLQKIKYNSDDAIYVNYLNQSNQYQIIICKNNNEKLEAEVFFENYTNNNSSSIDIYVTKDFFVIYKNAEFYYYKNIEEELEKEELLLYVKKSLFLHVDSFFYINEEELKELKKQNLNRCLVNINKSKKYAFKYYLFYLIFLLSLTYFYFYFFENKEEPLNTNLKNEYIKLKEKHKYIAFESELVLLIESLSKYNTILKEANLDEKRLSIVIQSQNKNNIYSFLEIWSGN